MQKWLIKILSIIALSIFYTSQSFACSCMEPESPEKSLEKATGVFIGTVWNIEKSWIFNELSWWTSEKKVYFTISQKLKSNYEYTTNITTANDWAACWYEFETGKEYLVYTYWEKENEHVSLCSRTSELIYAQDDLEAFSNLSLFKNETSSWWETPLWENIVEPETISHAKPINIPIIIILIFMSWLFIYFRKHWK